MPKTPTASWHRASTVTIIADSSPPTIGYTLNGDASPFTDPTAWYTGDVAIAWTVADAESAISSEAGCNPSSITSDTTGATATCAAVSAGGSASVTTASIRRDATAPTITAAATTAPNANGWYSGNVTVQFACSEATSGVAGACPADVVLTASGSSATPTIFDNAGNSATSNAVTVRIDKSAPSVGYAFVPPRRMATTAGTAAT